jgi:hypothetical protein
MTQSDEEDHARGARVEVAIHYAQKGDLAQAYGIAAGLPLAEREALIQIIAAVSRSDSETHYEARQDGEGTSPTKPHNRGRQITVAPEEAGSAVTPAPAQLPERVERVESNTPELRQEQLPEPPPPPPPLPQVPQQAVVVPRPVSALYPVRPAGWSQPPGRRGLTGRIGAMAVWGLFKGAVPVVIDEETGLTDQEQRVRDEYGHRAALALLLGFAVMLAYLLWRVTTPLRGHPIGSAVSILGYEASIALIVLCVWAGLKLIRRWAVNQYWDRSRKMYK